MVHHEHKHAANARNGNRRALAVVLALTASFTVVEIVGGLLTGSLALLADAGHMLSDNLSLGVALFAAWLAGRAKTPEKSFAYKRVEILAVLANGDAGGGLDLDLRGGPLAPAGAAGDPRQPHVSHRRGRAPRQRGRRDRPLALRRREPEHAGSSPARDCRRPRLARNHRGSAKHRPRRLALR